MTPAEVGRAIESANRLKINEAREQASRDYTLATLIVRGVGICLGDKNPFPSIQEAYPDLFDDLLKKQKEEQEAKIQEQKMTLSALRFKQFASFHNKKFTGKEVAKKIDE